MTNELLKKGARWLGVLLTWIAVIGAAALPVSAETPASQAVPPVIPASAFAGRSLVSNAELAPDGSRFAISVPTKDSEKLFVIDAVTLQPVFGVEMDDQHELRWFRWAGNGRLLVSMTTVGQWFGWEVPFSRLHVLDVATRQMRQVGGGAGVVGDDVVHTDPDGNFVLLEMQKTPFEAPAVWRYDLADPTPKSARKVQDDQNQIVDWLADDKGVVRMGFARTDWGGVKIWYRSREGEDLRTVARVTSKETEAKLFEVVGIMAGTDDGFALEKDDSGHVALRRYNYATRTPGDTVHAVAGHDVEAVINDRDGRPIAVTYTDDRQRTVWLDRDLDRVVKRLETALAGMQIKILSRARDGSRVLVWAGRDDDPGAIYVFTPKEGTLKLYAAVRPDLDPAQLATPRAVRFTARDGLEIHGVLTLPRGRAAKALPLVLLPHGGPYGIRDRLEYADEVQFLANRGYAVLQPNFRGSGGYGEAFEQAGRGQIGRKMQDDLDDAMDWAVKEGIADPKRVCVVGASYGGYAALWAAIRNPERYRCAASFAGVTDWNRQLAFNSSYLRSKDGRRRLDQLRGDSGRGDLGSVSPALHVARLTRPVLLAHGALDSIVPPTQYNQMRKAADDAGVKLDLLFLPKAGHGFSRPDDAQAWYDKLGAFLLRNNPPN